MTCLVQREAAEIREEWLGWALSTLPADRRTAEEAISGLYQLAGFPPPRFHWVTSPVAAMATVPPGIHPRSWKGLDHLSKWPLPARLNELVQRLWLQLDAQVRWGHGPMNELIKDRVRASLSRSAERSVFIPIVLAHDAGTNWSRWYSTQGVSWIAHYDALRRAAGVVFAAEQSRQLELWATAARSCGWWWPQRDICVVSERPVTIRTEVWGDNGEVRLHAPDGPAIRYADGFEVHAWHGVEVPSWVITDPDVQRIDRESNIEIRRCAIERIGWPSYIEQARLWLLAAAPDPGNPGAELRLYDMRKDTRVLLAINGSVERDGTRRQYGLTVPGYLPDPITAAGWTYGLSAEQYSQLARRT
ncbi:DUF6745 domain-containing protein [Acrocarpospora sp. B8E8]|uniref:DUF6745 domain-containing protein n=1 Tax=Acrocarpospora sp. B8E8 TaxID=3153572 RepID=UPI00325FD966